MINVAHEGHPRNFVKVFAPDHSREGKALLDWLPYDSFRGAPHEVKDAPQGQYKEAVSVWEKDHERL